MGLKKFVKRLKKKVKKKAKLVGSIFKKPKMPGYEEDTGTSAPAQPRLVSKDIGVAKVRFYTDDPSL